MSLRRDRSRRATWPCSRATRPLKTADHPRWGRQAQLAPPVQPGRLVPLGRQVRIRQWQAQQVRPAPRVLHPLSRVQPDPLVLRVQLVQLVLTARLLVRQVPPEQTAPSLGRQGRQVRRDQRERRLLWRDRRDPLVRPVPQAQQVLRQPCQAPPARQDPQGRPVQREPAYSPS